MLTNSLSDWLKNIGLEKYAPLFESHEIDLDVLWILTENDLRELGLPIGPRRVLLNAIAEKKRAESNSRNLEADASAEATTPAEHRFMTVMFCDMVGSTDLSQRYDAETLRDLIRQYQDAVTVAVQRYDGHVARYMGDGVLAYFGWPRAFEDQAERAARAALQIIPAVRKIRIEGDSFMQSRIGIATGDVVIGDLIGEVASDRNNVTGETPNLAQRLQSSAKKDQILVDSTTRLLVDGHVTVKSAGDLQLKGFQSKVASWSVTEADSSEASPKKTVIHDGSHMIGREQELQAIREAWELSKEGEGQIISITGEPGIGKSRLKIAAREMLSEEEHARFVYQCSPYHTNSALYPVTQSLRSAAGFETGDTETQQFTKLKQLLNRSSSDLHSDVPLIANLLSVPVQKPYEAVELPAKALRQKTVQSLANQLIRISKSTPVVLVFEDAHWSDPTTRDLFHEIGYQAQDHRILLMATFRSGYTPPWLTLTNQVQIHLHRLSKRHCRELVHASTDGKLGGDVVEKIVDRADGVPLFVEELSKSALEYQNAHQIPDSLQSLIASRLDHLGQEKIISQFASAIGRTFSYEFIRSVYTESEETLESGLNAMVDNGILIRSSADERGIYSFKHALFQDVAYASMLKSVRKRVHCQIADVLSAGGDSQYLAEPEVIARHHSQGEQFEQAVQHWLNAGQSAYRRSSNLEAVAIFKEGLRDLDRIPASPERDELEFELRIAFGAALLAAKGWSAPGVARNYDRVEALSANDGDDRKVFVALRGQANVCFLNGELGKTQELLSRLLKIAKQRDESDLLIEALRSNGMCALFSGHFKEAKAFLQRANGLYVPDEHHILAQTYGTDPGVVGYSALSWAHWFLGEKQQAFATNKAALSLAEDLNHPFSMAYAEALSASLQQFANNANEARGHAENTIQLAEQHSYPYWMGWGLIVHGWTLAAMDEHRLGIRNLRRGLEIYEQTGARQIWPYAMTLLSETLLFAGKYNTARYILGNVLFANEPSEVRFYQARSEQVYQSINEKVDR